MGKIYLCSCLNEPWGQYNQGIQRLSGSSWGKLQRDKLEPQKSMGEVKGNEVLFARAGVYGEGWRQTLSPRPQRPPGNRPASSHELGSATFHEAHQPVGLGCRELCQTQGSLTSLLLLQSYLLSVREDVL